MKSLFSVVLSITLLASLFLVVPEAQAIPTYSRKYKTSCSTCHYAFPKLNGFGKAFKNNGYRYPAGQDPEMTKEDPVILGAPGYKRVWPDAIWPTDMAGTLPLSVHAFGRIHYDDAVQDKKSLFFEIPHELEILFSGTFGDKISYFGEVELEHEMELAYEFAVQYDFSPAFHLKFGSVGLQASPEHLRLTREHYNVVDLKTQSGTWRLRNGAGGGVELWGAGNGAGGKGGFTYAVGVGNGQNDDANFDLNKEKDFYGRVTYKIGGLGEIGGTAGQASEESAFYIDNSLRFGGFFYSGTAIKGDENDKFSVIGVDVDWWFNRVNMTVLALRMKSDYMDAVRTSFAYFCEGNYVIYPWLIGRARYEYTDPDTDDDIIEAAKSIVPGVVVMVRANVKFSLEYLIPLDDARSGGDRFTFQFNFAF